MTADLCNLHDTCAFQVASLCLSGALVVKHILKSFKVCVTCKLLDHFSKIFWFAPLLIY
jgi:hypothetical protein